MQPTPRLDKRRPSRLWLTFVLTAQVYIKMWWQYLRSKGQFGLYSAIMKVIVFFCFPLVPFLWLIELGYAIFIAGVYRVFGFLLRELHHLAPSSA